MDGYNFTERVRRVLMLARQEAIQRNHPYVGAEHLLLGLLAEGEGVGAAVLHNHRIDLEALNQAVAQVIGQGTSREGGPDLPYTRDAKRVLEHAMREARRLQHQYVGTEHLLLGVLSVNGISAEFLRTAGITLESAREEMVVLLGHRKHPDAEPGDVVRSAANAGGEPISVTVTIEYADGVLRARKFASAAAAGEYLAALGR
jgi:ATP-dependent Clp protease ATP-binding subunit ClpC